MTAGVEVCFVVVCVKMRGVFDQLVSEISDGCLATDAKETRRSDSFASRGTRQVRKTTRAGASEGAARKGSCVFA